MDAKIASLEAQLAKHVELDARQKALDEREKSLRADTERVLLKEVVMDRIVADTRAAGAQACVSAVHQALALMNGGGKKDEAWNFSGNFNIPWPTPGGYPQNQNGGFSISKNQG